MANQANPFRGRIALFRMMGQVTSEIQMRRHRSQEPSHDGPPSMVLHLVRAPVAPIRRPI
jgi:hypothetical protein